MLKIGQNCGKIANYLPLCSTKICTPAGDPKGGPWHQRCKSLLSIVGDNLQFYHNFALFSTLGGINLDHDFFYVSKLSREKKKGLHQKWNQVRSQKFVKGGANFWVWGRSLQPPKANGGWGRRPQLPEAEGLEAKPPEARGSGGGAPSAQKFCIFLQK